MLIMKKMQKKKKRKNKRKNKTKKNNYNNIIEMQKAQSFQQPRDYNFMPNKNKSKQKIVIGIENNNNIKNNYSDEKAKNARLKTEESNNRLKYNNIRENDNKYKNNKDIKDKNNKPTQRHI